MVRDAGWIHVFCENGQEVYDAMFHTFRVAEDQKVSLPVMVNVDGFTLTHVIEPIEFWTKEMAAKYLPRFKPLNRLHPDKVVSMGAFGMPEIYVEQKMAHDHVLIQSKDVIVKAWEELEQLTGRNHKPVETYKVEGAETLIVGMGSICETASIAVDRMRNRRKVGLVKLRLWRPLPMDESKSPGPGERRCRAGQISVPGAASAPVTSEWRTVMFASRKDQRSTAR